MLGLWYESWWNQEATLGSHFKHPSSSPSLAVQVELWILHNEGCTRVMGVMDILSAQNIKREALKT
jgi:hypothetical protein